MGDIFRKAREWVWLEGDPEKDRSTGLQIAGVLEIILGVLSFSLAMLLLIVVSASGLAGLKTSHFWIAMGFQFFLTGWLTVMGLGSIKAKRWARALVLVGAWTAVFFGTLALALVLYILPELIGLMMDSGLVAPTAAMPALYFVIFVLFVLQIVFPLAAISFYSMNGVRVTCERRNPDPCWTDRVPLPLLAMGFISTMGCFSIVTGATTNYVVFLFGKVVMGMPGAAIVALLSIGFGYVGWGAFTRKIHAWWGGYALVLLTCSSMMLTFAEMDMETLYGQMGYSPEQIVQLGHSDAFNPAMLTFVCCIWGIMACIFLVWVRDCFYPEKNLAAAPVRSPDPAGKEADKPPKSSGPRMRLGD
ncbi:hypothetical protein [Pontiella sp.]|uniref:hypothetical protein n=1 Tax=Pontiella sp. TaxID=2837462 RepID=UPI0035640611